jgi:hypothetical protein
MVRLIALGAMGLGVLWVLVVVFSGGFALSFAGRRFSSHEPMRPLYWTTLPLALFVWANGAEATARSWRSWIARIDHRLAVLLLAAVTFGLGVGYGELGPLFGWSNALIRSKRSKAEVKVQNRCS